MEDGIEEQRRCSWRSTLPAVGKSKDCLHPQVCRAMRAVVLTLSRKPRSSCPGAWQSTTPCPHGRTHHPASPDAKHRHTDRDRHLYRTPVCVQPAILDQGTHGLATQHVVRWAPVSSAMNSSRHHSARWKSVSRTRSPRILPIIANALSPELCPKVSLIVLEIVDIQDQQRQGITKPSSVRILGHAVVVGPPVPASPVNGSRMALTVRLRDLAPQVRGISCSSRRIRFAQLCGAPPPRPPRRALLLEGVRAHACIRSRAVDDAGLRGRRGPRWCAPVGQSPLRHPSVPWRLSPRRESSRRCASPACAGRALRDGDSTPVRESLCRTRMEVGFVHRDDGRGR